MTSVQPGQVWEMYHSEENRWSRVIVTSVDEGNATLRHEGVLEFVSADVDEMQNTPELFRPAVPAVKDDSPEPP